MIRLCTGCQTEKPTTEFYQRKRAGKIHMARCKVCEKAKIKEWRINNPDAHKTIYTRARYKSVYGLNVDEVPKTGDCPICKRKNLKLVVDHCHKSGKVRDFICYNCNTLLGHIENEDKMKAIKGYLKKHE